MRRRPSPCRRSPGPPSPTPSRTQSLTGGPEQLESYSGNPSSITRRRSLGSQALPRLLARAHARPSHRQCSRPGAGARGGEEHWPRKRTLTMRSLVALVTVWTPLPRQLTAPALKWSPLNPNLSSSGFITSCCTRCRSSPEGRRTQSLRSASRRRSQCYRPYPSHG